MLNIGDSLYGKLDKRISIELAIDLLNPPLKILIGEFVHASVRGLSTMEALLARMTLLTLCSERL